MKKFIIGLLIIGVIICLSGFLVYKFYLSDFVADAIMSKNEVPAYVPKRIKAKIEYYKAPVNESAETVIKTMHESRITLDQIFEAIDAATEEQAFAMLEDLNATKIENTNQVFDIAKKHFPVDFDVEVFRKPFNEKADINRIKKMIVYANAYKNEEGVSIELGKAIAKKVLLQKEKEYKQMMGYD